jgi:hypothetical protein
MTTAPEFVAPDYRTPVTSEALAQMRERTMPGDRWAAYQNMDLGHPHCGDLRFLVIGEGRTFHTAPPRYPDHPELGLGWRYSFIGWVDLEKGVVL